LTKSPHRPSATPPAGWWPIGLRPDLIDVAPDGGVHRVCQSNTLISYHD
jgi:hypothetical protein